MKSSLPRSHHLFVVRMWQETDAVSAGSQWRGSVQHVLSEQIHYFTQLQDLLRFITEITDVEPSSVPDSGLRSHSPISPRKDT
ncbi:MAG: hypothetical protein R3C14_18330 [Caldilineaceae bacterium]